MTIHPIKPGVGFNSIPKPAEPDHKHLYAQLQQAERARVDALLAALDHVQDLATEVAGLSTVGPGVVAEADKLSRLIPHVSNNITSLIERAR